jgi:hypothetical protein
VAVLITVKILDNQTADAVRTLRGDGYCLSDVIRKALIDKAKKLRAQEGDKHDKK